MSAQSVPNKQNKQSVPGTLKRLISFRNCKVLKFSPAESCSDTKTVEFLISCVLFSMISSRPRGAVVRASVLESRSKESILRSRVRIPLRDVETGLSDETV